MSSSSLPMHQRRPNSGNSVGSNGRFNSNGSTGNGGNMYGRNGYNRGDVERGGGRANDTNSNILEQQNNDRISELSDQVARLKGLTIDIGNEVRTQNSLLDTMGDGFMSTKDMLSGSLKRIGTMLQTTGGKHMCYMVLFVVFAMVFLYWVMTYKGQSGV